MIIKNKGECTAEYCNACFYREGVNCNFHIELMKIVASVRGYNNHDKYLLAIKRSLEKGFTKPCDIMEELL